MSRLLRIILVWQLFANPFIASNINAQSQFRFRHFTTDDGLPNGNVMYLMTDSLGYVWCQHPNSLSRFDGYSFKVFQYDEHDPKRNALNFNIVGMIRDATGNIWAGQQQISNKPPFRLVKYDWKLDKFEKYDINAPGGFNAPQFEKDNSAMWAHSTRGGALSISILNLVS